MNTTETLQRFEELANHYLEELNQFSIEQLLEKPTEEEWSLGQMYIHLIQTALYMQLRNIDQCRTMKESAQEQAGAKSEAGMAVFAQGGFPAIRIQVPPSAQYTPQQPESKEQIIEGLQTVLQRMREIEPILHEIPTEHTVDHPRFGGLNAQEWFALIEMHYRHHLHQKKRLTEKKV
ncbi:DinB family protein [Brevibacillus ginsengisoli]|uniref:DinB family protein n=1 Tax=Brevibacillus ginsengisoli TaxID=363854 RepID=UPI003CF906FE